MVIFNSYVKLPEGNKEELYIHRCKICVVHHCTNICAYSYISCEYHVRNKDLILI